MPTLQWIYHNGNYYYFVEPAKPITVPWIYHNEELGLISLSSDGSNWITIADKNLWATTVWDNWDTLSEANCGWYFQWGNNYMFPFAWTVTTSSTRVNASTYWPWNYYSSSTFITNDWAWDTTDNGNLRWGNTWTNEAMQWPCSNWYHMPLDTEWLSVYNVWTGLWWWTKDWPAFWATLKLPLAWARAYYDASLLQQDTQWYYWASTRYSTPYGYCLLFWNNALNSQWWRNCAFGFSIRPFKNKAVQPDENWSVLYQPS